MLLPNNVPKLRMFRIALQRSLCECRYTSDHGIFQKCSPFLILNWKEGRANENRPVSMPWVAKPFTKYSTSSCACDNLTIWTTQIG